MLIYGKEIREKIKEELRLAAKKSSMSMTVLFVGNNESSGAYVKGIQNFARDVGIDVQVDCLASDISEEELIKKVERLNHDPEVTGIMIQRPLPDHIDEKRVVNAMDYRKDVEGIHYYNLGRLVDREKCIKPSTPLAVIRMLQENNIELEGKKVTIVGRSTIVGSPLALMMMAENATVSICHSRTRNLANEIKNADIVVVATGKINLITADMVNEDSIIIDVGTNFDENGKMHGDVDQSAKEKARIASAVPGGVGTITVAELFNNLRILSESNY